MRSNTTAILLYCTTINGDRDYLVAAVLIWNGLPQHITSASSLPVFCSRLKTHFFELWLPVILLLCPRSDTVIYGNVNRSYLLTYTECKFAKKIY